MTEQLVHSLLLALHNLAAAGCAAAPFYNRALVVKRGQYGPKLHYELDKVVEDTLQGNAPYCIAFIGVLVATGVAIPLNYLLFHGALRPLHAVALVALVVKLLLILALIAIMVVIFFRINPRLRDLFARFAPGQAPEAAQEQEFFALRARRRLLCERCLVLAAGVLVASAFLAFGT